MLDDQYSHSFHSISTGRVIPEGYVAEKLNGLFPDSLDVAVLGNIVFVSSWRPINIGDIHDENTAGNDFLVVTVGMIVEGLQIPKPIVACLSVLGHYPFDLNGQFDDGRHLESDMFSVVGRNRRTGRGSQGQVNVPALVTYSNRVIKLGYDLALRGLLCDWRTVGNKVIENRPTQCIAVCIRTGMILILTEVLDVPLTSLHTT